MEQFILYVYSGSFPIFPVLFKRWDPKLGMNVQKGASNSHQPTQLFPSPLTRSSLYTSVTCVFSCLICMWSIFPNQALGSSQVGIRSFLVLSAPSCNGQHRAQHLENAHRWEGNVLKIWMTDLPLTMSINTSQLGFKQGSYARTIIIRNGLAPLGRCWTGVPWKLLAASYLSLTWQTLTWLSEERTALESKRLGFWMI